MKPFHSFYYSAYYVFQNSSDIRDEVSNLTGKEDSCPDSQQVTVHFNHMRFFDSQTTDVI